MAKLINGNGNPAIYAAEDADLIASLAGNVTCIANVGNKYAATEEDATTIRLDDGVIITKEGRRIQLEAGESDTFYIPTGTSGQTNYYIIGYKLVQNADSTQVAEQFVQKMNSSSETITEDTFRSGATEVYVSVYRVTQVGFTIDSISGLLPELLDNASIKDNIDQINSDLADKYLLKSSYERITLATQTGSKTIATLMSEAITEFRAINIPSGEYWEVKGVLMPRDNYTILMTAAMPKKYTSFAGVNIDAFRPDANNGYIGLKAANINGATNQFAEAQVSITSGNIDFHQSFNENVPSYGISIYVDKFVKIS